jgi:hypothetical protein
LINHIYQKKVKLWVEFVALHSFLFTAFASLFRNLLTRKHTPYSMRKDTPTVLVAMLPHKVDWKNLNEKLWYRIPKTSAPEIIKNGTAKFIAFYHTARFDDDRKYKVVNYALIKRIATATRQELFPDEPLNSTKAHKTYYKLEIDELLTLEKPIVSRRGHRIVFVPTTEEKFFSGKTDFNILFKSSYLESDMERIMEEWGIEYEREYREFATNKKYYDLDFAIFCKNGKIDIECDGDEFHMGNENVHRDKTRNNELEGYGWAVLRYTTKHFKEEREHIKKTIQDKIRSFGGPTTAANPDTPYMTKIDLKGQFRLFQYKA